MNIKLLVLKNGFTLMGEVDEKDSTYILKKPVHVVQVPPRQGSDQAGIAFTPFLEFSDEFMTGFEFKKDDVFIHCSPVTELMNQYNRIFGSGIEIASSVPRI